MRTDLSAGTQALLDTGFYETHWRIQVANADDTLIDLSGRPSSVYLTAPSSDATIGTARVEFVRDLNDDPATSLAPLIASDLNVDDAAVYAPLLQLGRRVVISSAHTDYGAARPLDADFDEQFRGRVAHVSWGGRNAVAAIDCNDQGGELQLVKGEAAFVYEAGTATETAVQDVLDDDGYSAIVLNVPVATSTVLGSDYAPGIQKPVWDKVQALASSIGRVCWWRYQADGIADLTLFTPDRAKATSDFTFPRIMAVNRLDVDEGEIFNVLYGEYSDADGKRVTEGPVEDAASITRYGGFRRAAWVVEPADSVVRTQAVMADLLDFAASDLSDPDVIATYKVPIFLYGECAVDKYTFPADDIHYDSPQVLAPFAMRHVHRYGEEAYSEIDVRGAPSGGSGMWRTRRQNQPPTEPDSVKEITVTVEDNEDGTMTVTVTSGAKITQIWSAYSLVAYPETPAKWAAVGAAILPTTSPFTITTPVESDTSAQLGLLWVEGRYIDPATGAPVVGDIKRVPIRPKTHIPAIDDDTGGLAAASITDRKQFAAAMPVFLPVATEGDKPADNSTADYVLVLENGLAYEWSGSGWVAYTDTPGLAIFPALTAAIVKAYHVQLDSLSELTGDMGIIVSGILRNAAATAGIRLDAADTLPGTVTDFLDLAATGTDPILKVAGFTALADGTTLVEDEVEKVAVLSHYDFRPSGDFGFISSVASTTLFGGTTAATFGSRMPVPPGAATVSVSITGRLAVAGNVCTLSLVKIDSAGTITTEATAAITSTTDQTISTFVTETVDATATYLLSVQLEDNSGTGDAPHFSGVKVVYTSHSYRETL